MNKKEIIIKIAILIILICIGISQGILFKLLWPLIILAILFLIPFETIKNLSKEDIIEIINEQPTIMKILWALFILSLIIDLIFSPAISLTDTLLIILLIGEFIFWLKKEE